MALLNRILTILGLENLEVAELEAAVVKGVLQIEIFKGNNYYRSDFVVGHGEYIAEGHTIEELKSNVYKLLMKIKDCRCHEDIDKIYDIQWIECRAAR